MFSIIRTTLLFWEFFICLFIYLCVHLLCFKGKASGRLKPIPSLYRKLTLTSADADNSRDTGMTSIDLTADSTSESSEHSLPNESVQQSPVSMSSMDVMRRTQTM